MARIGFHISKNGRTMEEAIAADMLMLTDRGLRPCTQIFVSGPQSTRQTLTPSDKRYIRAMTSAGTPVLIHGAYIDNPWSRSANSVPNIKREMEVATEIGADGVIVHLAAGSAHDPTLRAVMDDLADAPPTVKAGCKLYLEINTAKQSAVTYETPEKVNRLFDRIMDAGPNGIEYGLCVDTAHVFSCGVSFADYEPTMCWLNALPDVPTVFHLNDSASTLGSGIDRHEALLHGNIWGNFTLAAYAAAEEKLPIEESGLAAVLEWTEANETLVILERGDGLVGDLELIRHLGYFKN